MLNTAGISGGGVANFGTVSLDGSYLHAYPTMCLLGGRPSSFPSSGLAIQTRLPLREPSWRARARPQSCFDHRDGRHIAFVTLVTRRRRGARYRPEQLPTVFGERGTTVGMTEVLLHGAEATEDERSKLRAHVGGMHCVPLAAMYAAHVATCLMRGEVVEDMETFEARLRQDFVLGNERGEWADRPIIFEGIVYGVWYNDETRQFVVDLTAASTSRGARSDVYLADERRHDDDGARRQVHARTTRHTSVATQRRQSRDGEQANVRGRHSGGVNA
jgi:hypothetical protein